MRRAHQAIGLALVPVAVVSCASRRTPPAPAVNHEVVITGLAYQPAELEVAPGDTVTWINRDIVPHTATSPAGQQDPINSGTLATGDSNRYVAMREGVYRYTCTFHPTMQGSLVVRAAAPADDRTRP